MEFGIWEVRSVGDEELLKIAYNEGRDNHLWGDVSYYLKNEVSLIRGQDSTTVREYERGKEAVNFVDRVLHNYQHYCNIIPE